MPLDPVIAQGFRGIQLQDPLEQYARANQLLQAQQQNQLNALKMQEYQREREVENKLAQLFQRPGADPTSPEFMREVYGISPLKGAAFQKSALETQKAQREAAEAEDKRKKAAADLAASYVKQARDQLPMVSDPQTYAAWRAQTLQRLPGFESLIPTDYSPQIVQRLALDADKMLEQHFVTQNLGGGQQVVSMPKYGGGSSTVVPGSFAAEVPLPPAVEAQKGRLAQAGAARTTVNVPPQPRKEQEARGAMLVDQYKGISDAARLATRTLPALETQERVLDAGFRTGFGAEAQKAGASLLAALGVPEAKDYATNAQAFSAAMSQAVLQKQLEQKGTQTKADADRIEQTGAQLTNTADANRFIINVARAQLKRDIAQRNFYDKWWKENKTYDGAEDAWATGEGNKSLFEDPALKKFAPAPAKPAPAAAPAATGSWRVVR